MEQPPSSTRVERDDSMLGDSAALIPIGTKPVGLAEPSALTDSAAASTNNDRDFHQRYHCSETGRMRFAWWKKEILSWFLSIVCLSCIIGTLFAYQNQEIPRWPHGITLNTIVAVLATLEMLFLEAPIASSVAQLKWNWFDGSHSLLDFVSIENASHGPMGSLMLILRRKGGILPILGALLMIAILSIPPFLQQVVSYQEGIKPTYNAYVSTTHRYGSPLSTIPLEQKLAIYGAMGGFQTKPPVISFCPTNNCTWAEYESLAICGRCNNITDHLDSSGRLPGGFGLSLHKMGIFDIHVPFPQTRCGTPFAKFQALRSKEDVLSFSHHDLKFSIFRLVIVSMTGLDGIFTGGPRAEECVLSFCTANFSATEINKHFVEHRTSSSEPWDANLVFSSLRHSEQSKNNITFSVQFRRDQLDDILAAGFAGALIPLVYQGALGHRWVWGTTQPNYYFDRSNLSYTEFLSNDQLNISTNILESFVPQFDGTLAPLIEDAAHRLTKLVRDPEPISPFSEQIPDFLPSLYNATGVAFDHKTLVQVRWGWMIFPISLEILAVVFLLSIMTDTYRRKLVSARGEGLASLFFGPEETLREEAYKMADFKGLEKLADTTIVTLSETNKGWRFVRSDGGHQDIEKRRVRPPVES